MSFVKAIDLAHTPPSNPIFVSLFRDVANASFLRDQLVAGNAEFEYAFIDASMIISPTHVLAAVFRAITNLQHARLRSRNVHSEIVFALSPNNNIAESFRRFGVGPATANLLAVKVGTAERPTSAEAVEEHLRRVVQGTPVEFGQAALEGMTDWAAVNRVYKLGTEVARRGGDVGIANGVRGQADGDDKAAGDYWRREAESAALGMIALKGS